MNNHIKEYIFTQLFICFMMRTYSDLKLYTGSFFKVTGLALVLGFILRIILLFNGQTQVGFSVTEWIEIFVLGAFNDLLVSTISIVFYWISLLFWSEKKYSKSWSTSILFVLALLFVVLEFFNTPLREFNKPLTRILCYIILWKFISFGIRTFIPSVRARWRQYTYYSMMFVYVTVLLFNVIAEYFFWSEFGVRYNFIAVDYLVYTNEVIGNIFESYPMIPLLSGLALVSLGITYLMLKGFAAKEFKTLPTGKEKAMCSGAYVVMAACSFGLLNVTALFQQNDNTYVNELQANGYVKFCNAYISNELNYNQFYATLPWKEVFKTLHTQYHSGMQNTQVLKSSQPELHKNIVLITIESMSGDYLGHFGNKENLTPNLDKMAKNSICFNNFYAVGNRTVRGLEAVTLCVPPSPGESIIKRENNGGLFSTGEILRKKGYNVQFMYGGDSYFDNMKTFFEGNDYKVVDQKSFNSNEITFKNVWGVCDEDMFNKAIKVFNKDVSKGTPFFGHIMTVSNHRPFTYPDGHIDIPSSKKSREGGIKYTDYAIGKFIEMASHEPWFSNTVFIITADHCASSAGSTDIPLENYHIPALIYAPGFIKPQQNNTLMSQIDLMPTLFGLLHFNYTSHFYGQDVLHKGYHPRAFAATYQDLGYWEGKSLMVLSPVRRRKQFDLTQQAYTSKTGHENKEIDNELLKRAIANYQAIHYVLKR